MPVDEKKIDEEKLAKEALENILKTYNELKPEQLAKIPQLAKMKTEVALKKIYVIGYTITHKISYAVGKAI